MRLSEQLIRNLTRIETLYATHHVDDYARKGIKQIAGELNRIVPVIKDDELSVLFMKSQKLAGDISYLSVMSNVSGEPILLMNDFPFMGELAMTLLYFTKKSYSDKMTKERYEHFFGTLTYLEEKEAKHTLTPAYRCIKLLVVANLYGDKALCAILADLLIRQMGTSLKIG